jgi:hypothetical protein
MFHTPRTGFTHLMVTRANDQYARATLNTSNTPEEEKKLNDIRPNVSPSVENLYTQYDALRRMKWLLNNRLRTGVHYYHEFQEAYHSIMSSIQTDDTSRTPVDTKHLTRLQDTAKRLMRASQTLTEEEEACAHKNLGFFYLTPADSENPKTILDSTPQAIRNMRNLTLEGNIMVVFTPYYSHGEWVYAGHLEYENQQGIRKTSTRISENSLFTFSHTHPGLLPGQNIKVALDEGTGCCNTNGTVSKLKNLFDALDTPFFRVTYTTKNIS